VCSAFFIDRPIFASVLSIVIALAGGLALTSLPVAQYPEVTPPQVQVSINYPGASAQVVADTVAAPIEQQVNGVEGMLYVSSQSGNDGSYTLSVTFDVGTDLNTALVMVQNRVTLAMPQLPTDVQRQGITIRKKTPDVLQIVSFTSPDGRYDNLYLSNLALISVRDELLRVDGVSDVNILGERDYSIRVWLDPQKLAARNLTALDVVAAIRDQNVEVAAGEVGQPPSTGRPAFEYPLDTLGRLADPERFGDIVVKAGPPPRPPAFGPVGTVAAPGSSAGGLQPASGTLSNATALGTSSRSTIGASGFHTSGFSLSGSGSSGGGSSLSVPYLAPSTSGMSSSTLPSGGGPGTSSGSGMNGTGSAGPMTGSSAGNTFSIDTNMARLSATPVISASIATFTDLTSAPPAGSSNPNATGGLVGPDSLRGGGLAAGPWPAAGVVRLRDVARIELGAQNYNNGAMLDGKPSVGLVIHLLPGANALDTADRIRAKMKELEPRFPDGVEYSIPYDTTPFIRESVNDVVMTLVEAIGLVAVVVLVFLQSWRASIIPLVAVPVAILGTFAVMAVVGFSLNNVSLFGLVLAIGIVVDDAIVVVENVQRWLDEGLPPREAAHQAMAEVTGPIVAIAVVLCAVFVPCAFVGGITGRFFRQFAVTIAASTLLSALNSLTLSPALAAIVMRKPGAGRDVLTRLLDGALGWFFRLFNRGFAAGTAGYAWAVGRLLRVGLVVLLVYAGLLGLTAWTFQRAPTGFIPEQDQGRLIVNVQLPDSASLERTQAVIARMDEIARGTPGVAHVTSTSGTSLVLGANSPNFGTAFVVLDPFDQRQDPSLSANAIMAKLRREFAEQIPDADLKVLAAPPIPGLSVAGGYKVMVEDRGGIGLDTLQDRTDALVAKLRDDPAVVGSLTQFRSRTPMLYLDVDRTKVQSLGVPFNDVNQTMQIDLGSLYANSFNEFGRYWQVTVQAEGRYRSRPADVDVLQVRNSSGDMVPLGTLARLRPVSGPVAITRYNLYQAAAVTGNVRPGVSSGEAIAGVNAAADGVLPRSMAAEWTEIFFLQIRAGNTAIYVFLLAVVCVFLALAALYESWAMPLAVILVVPMCLLCSVAGVLFTGKSVDVFVQIGLVVLVGLACKNAILIVEFAAVLRQEGKSPREAAVEASRLRLRPILMTSFAFILGVAPLVWASGAGAEMRRSLGTAVFSGMLGVTLFGVFLTPVFFDLIQRALGSAALATRLARWGGSALLGGAVGLAAGYSLAKLGVGGLVEAPVAGAAGGALLALILPSLWQRVSERVVKRRARA
jgi:multidrug efflux pump